jgi:fatty acid desaturase
MATDNLNKQLDTLNTHLPDWMSRSVDRVRRPGAVWVRVPLAIVLIIGGFAGFLPILGFWMVPLGVALLALDVPFMRAPLAKLLRWINRKLAQT